MKRTLLTFLFVSAFAISHAQEIKKNNMPSIATDFHSHRGFHFEFGLGPAFGTITDEVRQGVNAAIAEFSGTGAGIELKFGGGIDDNLVLTFDILSKAIVGPTVTINGRTATASDDYSLSE